MLFDAIWCPKYKDFQPKTITHLQNDIHLQNDLRPIYIGKNQNPKKPGFFCCTVYTARKTHHIRGFWHEKRMREKTPNLILVFW